MPGGTDFSDVSLHVEVTRNYIHTVSALNSFKKYLSLHEYNFSKPLSGELLLKTLESLMQSESVFMQPYGKVSFAFDAFPLLIPKGFEAHVGENSLIETLDEFMICIHEHSALHQLVRSKFNPATFGNMHTAFLKQVLNLPAGVYTMVNNDSLTIAAIEQPGKLLLFNNFEYRTADDFLYFLLLVCDELKINREIFPLVLCGKVQQQSKIYDVCYRYFSNIVFLKPSTGFHFSKALNEVSPHVYFTLLGGNFNF